MKKYFVLIPLLMLPLSSCANVSRNSAYAQDKTVTLDEWSQWAEAITASVLEGLADYDKGTTLAFGDFTNNSTRMDVAQDKDVFLGTLQKKLVNSKRVKVTRLYSGTGGRTDSVTLNSGDLVNDPQFKQGSTQGFYGEAAAAQVVLSMAFNQKRTVNDRGDNVFENYFQIELIDQKSKNMFYSDDVRLNKQEGSFRKNATAR